MICVGISLPVDHIRLLSRPAPGHVLVGVRGTCTEARVGQPELQPEPGDTVWVVATDRGKEVVDRAVEGQPSHPEWIRRTWFPLIEAEYATMDTVA